MCIHSKKRLVGLSVSFSTLVDCRARAHSLIVADFFNKFFLSSIFAFNRAVHFRPDRLLDTFWAVVIPVVLCCLAASFALLRLTHSRSFSLCVSPFARVCVIWGGFDIIHSSFQSADDIFSINWLRYGGGGGDGDKVIVVVVVVMHMRRENEAKEKTSNKTERETQTWKWVEAARARENTQRE